MTGGAGFPFSVAHELHQRRGSTGFLTRWAAPHHLRQRLRVSSEVMTITRGRAGRPKLGEDLQPVHARHP
jgi:hypothetical protein